MVSKASEDLPEPDSPVNTTSWSRGMSRSTFLRLCSRAPRIEITRRSAARRLGAAALAELSLEDRCSGRSCRQLSRDRSSSRQSNVVRTRPLCQSARRAMPRKLGARDTARPGPFHGSSRNSRHCCASPSGITACSLSGRRASRASASSAGSTIQAGPGTVPSSSSVALRMRPGT